MRSKQYRRCAHCGEPYPAAQEHRNYTRKFCSRECSGAFNAERAREADPPRDEVVRLYCHEGLSDAKLGRHYGRSYQWAFMLRKRYGIPGRTERQRKPLNQRKDRSRWGIHLKPADACRNCGGLFGVLSLHHVVPRSMCKASRYDLRNGLQLCTSCHLGWHHRGVVIYRDVFTESEWAYLVSIDLLGQNIDAWLDERYPRRPADGGTLMVDRCRNGHPYDAENTAVRQNGRRRCRACAREAQRRVRAKQGSRAAVTNERQP